MFILKLGKRHVIKKANSYETLAVVTLTLKARKVAAFKKKIIICAKIQAD